LFGFFCNMESNLPAKKESAIDFYRKLWTGKTLAKNEKQNELLNIYKQIFHYQVQGFPRHEVARLIAKESGKSESNCWKLVRDVDAILGKFEETSKKAERHIAAERWLRLAKQNEDDGKIEAAIDCYKRYDKIKGLEEPDAEGLMDPADFMRPSTIIFKVIESPKPQTENIDYEIQGN